MSGVVRTGGYGVPVARQMLRWGGLACAVLLSVLVGADHALGWVVTGTDQVVIGADLYRLDDGTLAVLHPVTQFHVAYSVALAEIAILLTPTVGVRTPRARLVAGGFAALVAAGLGVVVFVALHQAGTSWTPAEVRSYLFCTAALGAIALLIMLAAVMLLTDAGRVYDITVAALLAAFGVSHLVAMWLSSSALGGEARLTVAAWLPGPGYLAASACVALAVFGAGSRGTPRREVVAWAVPRPQPDEIPLALGDRLPRHRPGVGLAHAADEGQGVHSSKS